MAHGNCPGAGCVCVTLLFRNESGTIDLWAFVSPFTVITLPATIFGMLNLPLLDLAAVTTFTDSVRAAAAIAFPGEKIALIMGFVGLDPEIHVGAFRVFNWNGIAWTSDVLILRLTWFGFAVIAAMMAIPLFDRFDVTTARRRLAQSKVKPAHRAGKTKKPSGINARSSRLFTLPLLRFKRVRVLAAELRLALKGHHWFWYAVTIGLAAGQLAAPFEIARMYLTPLAMVWPLVIWSSMGTREARFNTGPMLISTPNPITHQLTALWLSGFMIAFAAVICMVARSILTGEISYALMLLIAAVLVPSASLAFGTLSGSRKLFEVVYVMIWYVGSIDRVSALDFLGTTSESVTGVKFFVLGILSLLFLSATVAARVRRLSGA